MKSTAEKLRALAPDSAKAAELLEQAEEMEIHTASMTPAGYDALTRKRMLFQSHMKKRGRPKPPSGEVYPHT